MIVEVHRHDECLIYVGGKHYIDAEIKYSDLLQCAIKLTGLKMDLKKAQTEVSACCMPCETAAACYLAIVGHAVVSTTTQGLCTAPQGLSACFAWCVVPLAGAAAVLQ